MFIEGIGAAVLEMDVFYSDTPGESPYASFCSIEQTAADGHFSLPKKA